MRDTLSRLYQTKLALLAFVFMFLGVGLLVVAHWPGLRDSARWLELLPLTDLGSALFTTGLVVIAFEYVAGKDADARAEVRLRAVLRDQAPAMRDAVIEGFAVQPEDLARVSSTATLDKVAENSLAIQLGDKELAADVYQDIRTQVLRAVERWEDVRVTVSLAQWQQDVATSFKLPLFTATIHWEYRVVLSSPVRRFACVSNLTKYRELSQEDASNRVWPFREVGSLTARSREAFELLQFTVDGRPCRIRRAERARSQIYSVNLSDAAESGEPVTLSYTYRTLIEQHGHLLHIDFDQPSRDVAIELRYDGCGIRHVNILDYLGGKGARVERSPQNLTKRSVTVAGDGWIAPRAGVAFVWVLDSEIVSDRQASHGALTA